MYASFKAISRLRLQTASVAQPLIGMLLAAPVIFSVPMLLYLLTYILAVFFACHINALFDIEVDSKYKDYMSNAVLKLGPQKVMAILLVELMALILCAFYFSLININVSLLIVAGIVLAMAYSALPFRLKARGLLAIIPTFFGLYSFPILAGYLLVAGNIPPWLLVFTLGYALVQQGITFVNTAEDYKEDKELLIKTPAHVFGIKNTLNIAWLSVLIGGLLVLIAFPSLSLLLIIPAFAFLHITHEIRQVAKKGTQAAARKGAKNLARWLITNRYAVLITILAVFFFLPI